MSIVRSLNYMITKEQLDNFVTSRVEDDMLIVCVDKAVLRLMPTNLNPETIYRQIAAVYGINFDNEASVGTRHDLYVSYRQKFKLTKLFVPPPPRTTNIVGFIGQKRAGKDTAAFALLQQGYAALKFAGALKAMLETYLAYVGVSEDVRYLLIEGEQKELPITHLQGKSTRHAMQTLGTEWGRNLIGDNIWVDAAIARAKNFDKVVFTDVRFPNEVAALRGIGATIIKITRPAAERAGDSHSSEALIDLLEYDFCVPNGGTVAELHTAVLSLLK